MNDLLTLAQAAAVLGVARATADKYVRHGLLPVAEMRRSRRMFRRADAERLRVDRALLSWAPIVQRVTTTGLAKIDPADPDAMVRLVPEAERATFAQMPAAMRLGYLAGRAMGSGDVLADALADERAAGRLPEVLEALTTILDAARKGAE